MPVFGIMHTIKLKVSNTMGVQLENNRTKLDCNRNFAGSQIEWDRTDENLHWVHSGNWDKSAYELCQKYDVPKVKKDSVIALQTVYTASRDWFTQDENGNIIFDEKAESFFRDCMKFHIENYCGGREDLLINCTIHLDEVHQDGTGAIHMHCTSVPIVENEKGEFVLSAKRVMGHRKEMTQAQQRFHDNVCKSRGMERGMSSNETKRKHLDNLTYQAQQEEKKLQKAQEAREEVQKGTKAQEVDLAVARAKTASEAHKTAVSLESRMDKVASKNFFGQKKEKDYPGGTYYEVAKGEYEELERHVSRLCSELEKIQKTDFAGKEAVAKLQELVQNEEQYILTIAQNMVDQRFREMLDREAASIKRQHETEQALEAAEAERAEIANTARRIATEAVEAVTKNQDDLKFVMEHLRNTNPVAFLDVQMALSNRIQSINREVNQRVHEHHQHHHR